MTIAEFFKNKIIDAMTKLEYRLQKPTHIYISRHIIDCIAKEFPDLFSKEKFKVARIFDLRIYIEDDISKWRITDENYNVVFEEKIK